ncbi:FkbM family methyltransferase [Clostridium butyricum]|uniref:Methyltransferase FkbM domain-containing protein n=1 Tax=Clostridium butyricum TaxID=1492 RepID=A0A2S7FAM0_CLOBU|nr:FkbM family methyltransferase [Clostridium butyricum]PPV14673.1 hypothetical protein AWN73_02885 [Clostridium butyricum]
MIKYRNNVDKEFYEILEVIKNSEIEDIIYTIVENLNGLRQKNIDGYNKLILRYNFYKYWGELKPEENNYELIQNRVNQLKYNNDKFMWMYNNLEDYKSKKIMLNIIKNWISFDFDYLEKIYDFTYEHYFDLDIINCNEEEVFLDIGAYIGDTVQKYIKVYGEENYKKIYCYEITPKVFERLKRSTKRFDRIECRMKGVSNVCGYASLKTNGENSSNKIMNTEGENDIIITTIDEDIIEKVTFLKMDIEGGEALALQGSANHIRKDHPKLAISIYHNNEDIWKLAEVIKEIDPTYRFYIRYYGGNLYPSEYILYGV